MSPTSPHITVITGGCGGLGAAIAKRLLRMSEDHRVVLLDIAPGVSGELVSEFGERVVFIEGNTADASHVAEAFRLIGDFEGRLWGLVNGAGNVSSAASVELSTETWHSIMAAHLDSAFLCSQEFGRRLITAGEGGSIVNIASVAGMFGHPRRLPYSVAKAGLMQMGRTLAVEWAGAGIRVNSVAPGYIETPLVTEVTKLGLIEADSTASWHALGRMGTPDEVASAVAYLLSNEASFVTGTTLTVDGGFSVLKAD